MARILLPLVSRSPISATLHHPGPDVDPESPYRLGGCLTRRVRKDYTYNGQLSLMLEFEKKKALIKEERIWERKLVEN